MTSQREALNVLSTVATPVLADSDRLKVREIGDRLTRYVEDLDALRERAAVTNDQLSTRLAETMNRRMYLLSEALALHPWTRLTHSLRSSSDRLGAADLECSGGWSGAGERDEVWARIW